MNRQWRQVLPPLHFTAIFFTVYILTYLADLYFILLGALPVPEDVVMIRVIVLTLAAGSYGFYRVRVFHPFYNKKYRQWLYLSPWSIDKPLPNGPVHLIWPDFIVLSVLTVLYYSNTAYNSFVPLIFFLFVYLFMIFLAFEADHIIFTFLFLFILPFSVYPFDNLFVTFLVYILLYTFSYVGFRKSFKDFPWNTEYWKGDIVEEFKKLAIKNNVIGWPYKFLNIYKGHHISYFGAFILSLLLTWWLHVFRWIIDEPYNYKLFAIFSLYTAFFITFKYVIIYSPPISLLGRIFTGRLIIPKYDKILIIPICILLAGIVLPLALDFFNLNEDLSFELCFFLIFFLIFSISPASNKWRLTGAYRISRLAQLMKPRPTIPQKQAFNDFFSAKFKSDK